MAGILRYYTEFDSFFSFGGNYLKAVEVNPTLSPRNVAKDILFRQYNDLWRYSQKLLRKSALTKGTSLDSEYSTCKVR